MKDIIDELTAVHRAVGTRRIPAGEGRTVKLSRRYRAPVADVWDAITDPDRIRRWFLPVTGDFRLGGSYQLEGNAGGKIMQCEPPHLLVVTWVFGENPSESDVTEVRVRLTGDGDETTLELEHASVVDPDRWTEFGPGAVGVGWDLTLLGLAMYLRGEIIEDPQERAALAFSPEGRQFITESSRAWGEAHAASGGSPEEVATAVKNTTAFYAPPIDPPTDPQADTQADTQADPAGA